MTGGRILRAAPYVEDKTFLLTYGDGVADVDLDALTAFHRSHGKAATLTTVQPEGRYGSVDSEEGGRITRFWEKPPGDSAWVNGGFFVCEPKVFDSIREGDATVFEGAPLEELAREKELYAYRHGGFWKCMDTLRDKVQLNRMWEEDKAAWKIWE